jgi:hypothetical protein
MIKKQGPAAYGKPTYTLSPRALGERENGDTFIGRVIFSFSFATSILWRDKERKRIEECLSSQTQYHNN